MACIEHYIKDAENIFDEIHERERIAEVNSHLEYVSARIIQKWFRGYITRKHILHLNNCATTIQKNWRGYVGRKQYFCLLQEAVHKMYLEHYNLMATKIQKVWRGHFVRSRFFSFYKLKEYIRKYLEKNKMVMEKVKAYKEEIEYNMYKQMQEECEEWLEYLSFKTHHLLRTKHIEGIYSKHHSLEYSEIEKHLKNLKFKKYMDAKRAKEKHEEVSRLVNMPDQQYLFKGRLRECEEVWLHRNDPGKLGLDTGEYGLEKREHLKREKIQERLLRLHDEPMQFGNIEYRDESLKLGYKKFTCPPLHRTVK